ncbi:MAG: PQQ-binding-like beta-propeller repeat protein, partial [Verrucomicrobiales bacterium]|nr:PQQ-binding-like beta-propeller repeat protein [Verrucomicrobiales bacterium]
TLFVVNGKPGDIYAVTPGGSGDVTNSLMKWHQGRKAGRDLPSPAAVGNHLVVVDMSGVGACFDTKTGEVIWNERIGLKGEVAASPLVAGGNVYFQNVFGGEVYVIKPGPKLDVVSVNSLGAKPDEIFRATLAPIQGDLFARSQNALYCIGK